MWQIMLGSSVATMVLTPLLLTLAPVIANRIGTRFRVAMEPALEVGIPPLSGHVIILGYGVGGQLVSRVLRDLQVPYLILELNGATVRRFKAEGERIFYGDATTPESLHAAHFENAQALVSLVSDPDATLRMVKAAREISPTVTLVVRSRYRLEAERLQQAGATVAVAEELEASLEVVAQLLARLNVPGNLIETLLDVFRREQVSLRPMRAPRDAGSLTEALRHTPVSTHRIEANHWGLGRSISELNLRANTNASVIAIQRGARYITAPSPDEQLQNGDVLYLIGDESDVMLARNLLSAGG
jgi:CPA2 family monovalent cation:H+ antiporter-2